MRHGQVDTGPGRRFLGRTDLSLDEKGREEARAWQPELAGIRLSRVVTSSLDRARQTAALCCPEAVAEEDARLNEINLGDWDGRTFEEIRVRFPDAFRQRGEDIFRYRPPGGESFEDLYERVLPFFEALAGEMAALAGHVLAITHAGVIRTMCCDWAGRPMEQLLDFRPGYGELLVFSAG